jgi:hypothetical protein
VKDVFISSGEVKKRGVKSFGREFSCKIAKYSIKLDNKELSFGTLK